MRSERERFEERTLGEGGRSFRHKKRKRKRGIEVLKGERSSKVLKHY